VASDPEHDYCRAAGGEAREDHLKELRALLPCTLGFCVPGTAQAQQSDFGVSPGLKAWKTHWTAIATLNGSFAASRSRSSASAMGREFQFTACESGRWLALVVAADSRHPLDGR